MDEWILNIISAYKTAEKLSYLHQLKTIQSLTKLLWNEFKIRGMSSLKLGKKLEHKTSGAQLLFTNKQGKKENGSTEKAYHSCNKPLESKILEVNVP